MQQSAVNIEQLYRGLQELIEGAFPKRCSDCGKVYDSLDSFVTETRQQAQSGLQAVQAGDAVQVALVRHCSCGSPLMEQFGDRRSQDDLGQKRRELFDRLLGLLTEGGMPSTMAKKELLKVMRGQPSALLSQQQLQQFFS